MTQQKTDEIQEMLDLLADVQVEGDARSDLSFNELIDDMLLLLDDMDASVLDNTLDNTGPLRQAPSQLGTAMKSALPTQLTMRVTPGSKPLPHRVIPSELPPPEPPPTLLLSTVHQC